MGLKKLSEIFSKPVKLPQDKRTVYVNARLLDPATTLDSNGWLLTQGAEIADVGKGEFTGSKEGVDVVDCGGHILCPGLIDIHAHLREPGSEQKETDRDGPNPPQQEESPLWVGMANTTLQLIACQFLSF